MKSIPYGRQSFTESDIAAVVDVLKSDFWTQGPQVELFEQKFSEMVDAPYAVAVCNATAALHLVAQALGVKAGDRVLVAANTFVASANCIRYSGGEVEFADIDAGTYCLDLDKLQARIAQQPKGYYKGIVAVDFAGYPMDVEKLGRIAKAHDLWVIEDACHAPGAAVRDARGAWARVGSCEHVDAAVFSFHPVKHIGTGEGGMITTRRAEIMETCRLLRSHGITKDQSKMNQSDGGWYYQMTDLGFNYRMPDILCALGTSQLQRLPQNLETRRRIAARYQEALQGLPLELPHVPESVQHAYHLYVIQTEERKALYEFLKTKGIYSQVHYIPVHTQPYYVERNGRQSLPVTEAYYAKALSLPMYHGLTLDEQSYVIDSVKAFYRSISTARE